VFIAILRGFSSEVETVRHLLDEALLQYDTAVSLLFKLGERILKTKVPKDAVRDTIFGHPLVASVDFNSRDIRF